MKKHFVTFLSPGTFVHETSTKEIDFWHVETAKKMARDIVERHGATPFAFYFSTRERQEHELDSKVVETSGNYYLGGKVETYDEVVARNDPNERILRDNMKYNNYDKIIINTNSFKVTQPLREKDVVLEWDQNSPVYDTNPY